MMERWSSKNIQYDNISKITRVDFIVNAYYLIFKKSYDIFYFFVNRIAIWLAKNATPNPQPPSK